LNRTLFHYDSEEIGKGINAISNERLNGYELGFGSSLSPNGSDPVNCWDSVLASWAAQAARAQGGRLGRAKDSAQKPNSNKKTFFFFKTIL
jgi:hypothetical protein